MSEFRRHEPTLQGGFIFAIENGNAEASFGAPAAWPLLKTKIPIRKLSSGAPVRMTWEQTDYMLGAAPVGERGLIMVAMPLPQKFSETVRQSEVSEKRYLELSRGRKTLRRTYMGMLLLLTVMVLFATTWLALFVSKLVTRPVAALAEATQEISRGRLDYRVEVHAADELGDLVAKFNAMAGELEFNRHQLETSGRELLQRREQIETILESI